MRARDPSTVVTFRDRDALMQGTAPHALLTTARIDWSRVHFIWSDERCVSPNDVESNYRMARETLLHVATTPATNVHRIHDEQEPARAACVYTQSFRGGEHRQRILEEAQAISGDILAVAAPKEQTA